MAITSEEDLAAIGRAVVDKVDDIVAVLQDGRVVFANRAALRIAGVDQDELIGSDFDGFLPGGDRKSPSGLSESTLVAGDGSIRRLELSSAEILFRGRPASLVIARDVTERKSAEEQLRDSEERYRFLFENTADSLLLQEVDPDGSPGRYLAANRAVCETLGYSREEILNLDLTDFATPELIERLPEIAVSLFDSGHAHFEAEYFARDGRRIPAEVFLHVFELRGKKYILSSARDLSEKKRTESVLRGAEERYRMVLDSANDAITVHQLDQEDVQLPGCFVEVNRTACRETGYTREELLAMTPLDLTRVDPEAIPRLREEILQDRRTTFDATMIGKDGRETEVEINAHLFDLSGTSLIVSVARNISVRKKAEDELRRAKEVAERANRAKSTFLANVSHELRTPLGGVLGMTEMLLDRGLEPDLLDAVQKIHGSAEDLRALIEDLLDLSVMEAGRLRIQSAPFELAACLEDAVSLARERFREKDLRLEVKLDPDLPDRVIADRTRIRQLLGNLLDNALKFTPQGGVDIMVERLGSNDGAAVVRFAVEDTGIGVPAGEEEAVFKTFTRLDNPVNRVRGGTGLGLAICKQLVEQMGGELGFTRREGGGSCFWFRLDLPTGDGFPATGRARDLPDRLRVLVVEDNSINQELTVTMLKRLGCLPVVAGNGKQALELTRLQDFPVILMDLRMPDMDGLSATAAIREACRANHRQPAIIAMTAQSREENQESCRMAGMNEFLCKPFTLDDLREVILRCVRPG